MAFNVVCVFSGACSYVPNSPLTPGNPPTKMAVILGDARKMKKSIGDGAVMVPHFPVLIVDSRFVPGSMLPPNTQIIWPLDRLALRIGMEGGEPDEFKLSLGGSVKRSDDFAWTPGMDEAAPDFTQIDPVCFDDKGSKGLVSARMIIDCGYMAAYDFHPKQLPSFAFGGALGSTAGKRKMANRTALEINDAREFCILWRRLDDDRKRERKFELRASEGKTVKLTIGNFCDGCLPKRSAVPKISSHKDDDFRWHYELCEERGKIKEALHGEKLPIPETKGSGGPGAIQCMSGGFASYSF